MPVAVHIGRLISADWTEKPAVSLIGKTVTAMNERNHFQGMYDEVFTEERSCGDVFRFAEGTVSKTVKGHSTALLIYGSTIPGKALAFFGDSEGRPGLAQLSFSRLFSLLSAKPRSSTVLLSILLIYSEKVLDLLHSQGLHVPLALRESSETGLSIIGLTTHKVAQANECGALLRKARDSLSSSNLPQCACTVVVRLTVSSGKASKKGTFRSSTMDICSIAGIEKNYGCGKGSDELTLRLSVSQLGKVVYSLANTGKATVAYFRGSKFTRLVQSTLLSGFVCFVVAVSPAKSDVEETIAALKFADVAKKLPLRLKKLNIAGNDLAFVRLLQKEVKLLREFCFANNIGLEGDDTFVAIGVNLSIPEVERLIALRSSLYSKLAETNSVELFAEFQKEMEPVASHHTQRSEGLHSSVPASISQLMTRSEQRSQVASSGQVDLHISTPDELLSLLESELMSMSLSGKDFSFEQNTQSRATLSPPPQSDDSSIAARLAHAQRKANASSMPPIIRENDELPSVQRHTPLQFPPQLEQPYLTFDQTIIDRKVRKDLEREEALSIKKRAIDGFKQKKSDHRSPSSVEIEPEEDKEAMQRRIDEEMQRLAEEKRLWKQQLDEKMTKDEQDLISLRRKMTQKPRIEPRGIKPRGHISRLKEMLLE